MAKEKFTLEYDMGHTKPSRLWAYLQGASGLESWFADRVEVDGKRYLFHWGDATQEAALLSMRRDVYVRYRWSDDEQNTPFELRISHSELTDVTTLAITDYADDEDGLDELTNLWNQQIDDLRRVLGIN